MEYPYVEFGRRLRAARTRHKLSQSYVAQTVGLNRTSVTNIELGRQRFPLHVAYLLADAVRTDPRELFPERFADGDAVHDVDLAGLTDVIKEWVVDVLQETPKSRLVKAKRR